MSSDDERAKRKISYTCVVGRCDTCKKVFDIQTYDELGRCPHCVVSEDIPPGVAGAAVAKVDDGQVIFGGVKYTPTDKPPWEE